MNANRRQFLGGLSALPIAAGVLPAWVGAGQAADAITPAGTPPLKLGLVTYNLAKDWDVPTIIRNCTATQFAGVELRTTHRHGVEVSLSKDERAEVRRRFADSPVELMGLGSAFDFHTPDPAKLQADLAATRDYLVLAHDVGATGVKVRPNGLPKEVPVAQTLAQIGRCLRELGEFARDLGQTLRLEVHGAGTSQVPHIRTIMDHARHPNVGVCWNSNQSDLDGAGFDANFDLLRERIVSVHMRDLFLAEYPWRRLLTRLAETGFRGYTLAEIPESADPLRVMHYYRALWLAHQGRA